MPSNPRHPRHLRLFLWPAVTACLLALLNLPSAAQPDDDASKHPPLSDEHLDVAAQLVGLSRPELAEQLADLKETNPRAYRKTIQRLASQERIQHLLMFHETDPEGFELRADEWRAGARAVRLSRQIRQAQGPAADDLKQELRLVVEQQFDARMKVRRHELASLEKRLESLRRRLEKSRDNRERSIEEQYRRLLAL